MNKTTVAAASLIGVAALTGATVLPGGAAAEDAVVHTKRLVLHETASHGLAPQAFAGTDKVRARASGKFLGFDSYTGTYDPAREKVVIHVAFALKGGLISVRATLGDSPRFEGKIVSGTGVYKGIEGTVTGRTSDTPTTYVSLHYHY